MQDIHLSITAAFTKRELWGADARAEWREGDGGGRSEATDDAAGDCSLGVFQSVRFLEIRGLIGAQ
jgi:hypothetical protein